MGDYLGPNTKDRKAMGPYELQALLLAFTLGNIYLH
jgi:hypothetical protein